MTILPIGLAFARPRWTAASMPLWNWIYPLSAIFVVGALWALRRRWGRGPITAALLFICLLIPSALGASDANDSDLPGVMVREHVLYLACCAVLVPLATLLCGALSSSKLTRKLSAVPGVVMAMTPVVSLMILVPLAIATFIHAAAYNDVKSLWENVLHGNGDSVVALNTLGQLDLDAKDYNSAEYHFLAALRADPDDAQSLLNLARVAESQQQFDEAIARYDEVLVPHPDNVSAHFGLAAALAGQGNTSAALAEYASVLKLDPRNVSVMNNIGLIYAGQGRVDDAIAEYQKAISTDGRSIMAYLNMANSLFQEGKLSDARDTLAKAIEIEPRNPIIWLNAGVMAEAVGDVKSAEKYFRWAIFYKFDSADAFNNLGMLLMREGDAPGRTDHVGEAIYDFKRAAELDPNNASLYEQSRMAALRRKDAILQQQQQR
jgi:tetratricopeptide (TPR) repeat protein